MPANRVTERSLRARVEIAQAHADPDVRALAEAVLAQSEEVEALRQRVSALEAPGDGK